MNAKIVDYPAPPPLPAKAEEWIDYRKGASTLADQVQVIHNTLKTDETYLRFLYAVYNPQSVEGSLHADNLEAAAMVRQKAKGLEWATEVAAQNKETIWKALNVVLRRHHQSRKQRRGLSPVNTESDSDSE